MHALLLVAEHALLAGVRIEAGDAEPRAGDAELLAQGTVGDVQRVSHQRPA